ncbi:hypothetical protein P171DRAFT_479302 [Karstenula rhodostoma CBS 690.94]|uniref:Uncharacterized protein n=1 Tax=Karstenula rhodostoma CBS 690.94 TaxID=1392251 RepID=A0A9P4PWH7_9PLEO|nr:hypothetical protein P171DRAFT_479302 [Karstenula rhodostoma CBS 690.94]
MSAFPIVPLFGLAELFDSASRYNEVREAAKFLGRFVYNILRTEVEVDIEAVFYDAVQMYTPESTLAYALALFGHRHFVLFEDAVCSSLASVSHNGLSLHHDNPVLLQIKDLLIRYACAPDVDPSGMLGVKLSQYVEPQPQLSDLASPGTIQSGNLIPELGRALHELEDVAVTLIELLRDWDGNEGYLHPVREDAFHIVREFMRLAMNCAAVWSKYGPKEGDLADGFPKLTEEALFAGHMTVSDAWRRMLSNPFSDAPLHVRRILARCNVIDVAGYFLVHLRQISHPYPALLSIDSLADRFVQKVQWAAEDTDLQTFHRFRETRLRNPFLGPSIPSSSFAPPLHQLDVTRQPFRESHQVSGIPRNDSFYLTEEAGIELPANFRRYEYLIDHFYGPYPTNIEDAPNAQQHVVQQQLLAEDVPVYSGQFELAAPPQLVAVGPLIRASHHSDPVNSTDPCVRLRACGHLLHLEELEQLLNGAYFDQPYVLEEGGSDDEEDWYVADESNHWWTFRRIDRWWSRRKEFLWCLSTMIHVYRNTMKVLPDKE